jgi:hypothetical protein
MAGRLPAFIAGRSKAVHQPQRRRAIAAILNEFEPFAIGDEIARQFYRADQGAMRGFFIVEMKAVAGVADGVDALVEGDPLLAAAGGGRKSPVRVVGGRDRVLGEGVQDVGQHQFLMLLFVVEADLQQRHQARQRRFVGLMEKFYHGGVDMLAVGGDFRSARAGEVAALGPGVAGAGADVIGIEQEGVIRVVGRIARTVLAEQKLLEEPGGMGAVPLRRTGVRHRLHQLVLGRQGGGAALGFVADGEIRFGQFSGKGREIREK